MTSRGSERLGDLLARSAGAIASHARWVVAGALLLAVGSAVFAARELRVQVDTVSMFRTDLPHLERWFAFAQHYPLMAEPLVVVIDAPEGRAENAAGALAEAMRDEDAVFERAYAPGAEPFFHRHGLLYRSADELAELGDRLAEAQPLLAQLDRDPTLPGLFDVLGRALEWPDRVPAAQMQQLLAGIEDEVDAATRPQPAGSVLADQLFGSDSDEPSARALVLALPRAGREGANPALPAMRRIDQLAEQLGLTRDGGYRVRVTGDLALSADELQLLNENALVTGVVAFLLVAGILLWGFRNLRAVVVLCLTLAIGLLWTAAFAALAVGRLNMISVAFAVMSIGLGIDFGIHLGLRYRELAERGEPLRSALRTAMRDTGSSLLWCALTTAVGFYAFLPTDFVGIAEFGLISGTGILLSVVATLVVLPALIAALRPRFPLRSARRSPRLEAALSWPRQRPRAVVAAAGALTVFAVVGLPALRFSGNPLALRVPDSDSASAFRDLLDAEGDTPWNLQVIGRTPEQARSLAADLAELDVVGRATTLGDLVPSGQEIKLDLLEDLALVLGPIGSQREAGGATSEARLEALTGFGEDLDCEDVARRKYLIAGACDLRASIQRFLGYFEDAETRDSAVALLESRLLDPVLRRLNDLQRALDADRVTLASLPEAVSELWQAEDGTWRVDIAPKGSLDSDAALAAFVTGVRTRVPDVTGMAVNVVEADRMVVESLRAAFSLAAVAIALLLFALWGRVGDTLRALAPIAMAALWILGGAAWLGMPLNFANVIVLPLILGIGIDSGVHLVERHRRHHGRGVDLLGTSTARAILLSCATTVASFGSLALSPHPGMASMGRLLVIGVVCTLLANLVVLPALLSLSEMRGEKSGTPGTLPVPSSVPQR